MEPREHLSMLLEWHDGDDRCGCLGALVWDLITEQPGEADVIARLSFCLAEHPAGITLRQSFTRRSTDG